MGFRCAGFSTRRPDRSQQRRGENGEKPHLGGRKTQMAPTPVRAQVDTVTALNLVALEGPWCSRRAPRAVTQPGSASVCFQFKLKS